MIDIGEVSVCHDDTVTYAHVVTASGKVKTTIHFESHRGLSGDSFEVTPEQAESLARFYAKAAAIAQDDARQLLLSF